MVIIFLTDKIFFKDDTPLSPTGVFSRSKSGGVITVKGNDGGNVYPPGPIRDLVILDVVEGESFNLSFTSPGDDLNSGNLNKFIVFYSKNKTELQNLTPSSNVSSITQDMLSSNASMESIPPFSNVILNIESNNFDANTEYSFRVLAVDSGLKTSKSNLVFLAPNNIFQV